LKSAAFSLVSILLLLGGCTAVPTPIERQQTLKNLSAEHNLTIKPIWTTHFTLSSVVSGQCEDKVMRVYIEGDGFSWASRSRLSDNPTPINPLAAKLMMIDPSGCKAYLARPCQYTRDEKCSNEYWSSRRFSPEVIQSYQEALDQLKLAYGIHSFALIGYSGGGAVVALTAANRHDISRLITVAGNLDTALWVKLQGLEPLDGSLNPADETANLENIPQIHFIGASDTVMPKEIFSSYRDHYIKPNKIESIECDKCTHNSGWEKVWERFSYELK
jgi:Serine hydrolase (FSH1)